MSPGLSATGDDPTCRDKVLQFADLSIWASALDKCEVRTGPSFWILSRACMRGSIRQFETPASA
jgi:hypothetical protein